MGSCGTFFVVAVAAAAVLCQQLLYGRLAFLAHPKFEPLEPCPPPANATTTITIPSSTSGGSVLGTIRSVLQPCLAFSESYVDARAKFRRAAEAVPGAAMHSLDVLPDQRGGSYTIDVAVLRGAGRGLVIHTSGVHGVEGYSGSAIQIAALHHLAEAWPSIRSLSVTPTMVFVHAVNPHGMANFRRWNERNVDLNRNALHQDEWPEILGRDPNVAHYDDFDETLFNPRRPPNAFDAYVLVWIKSVYAILRFGFVNMKRAMVAAQYHNHRGIFYGGRELEASHRLLWKFLKDGGFGNATGTVTWVDVHTGLGPSGVDTLLVPDVGDAETWFKGARIQDAIGSSAAVEDSSRSQDVVEGYDLTRGVMNVFYVKLFGRGATTTGKDSEISEKDSGPPPLIVTQEFGTVHPVRVARAMILENMAYNHGPPDDDDVRSTWSEFTRDAFYVRTNEWRSQVLRRGLIVLCQAVARSSTSS